MALNFKHFSFPNVTDFQREFGFHRILILNLSTVEPRYNEVPRDWQNLFARTRFRYIEVLFHVFYNYWGKQSRS